MSLVQQLTFHSHEGPERLAQNLPVTPPPKWLLKKRYTLMQITHFGFINSQRKMFIGIHNHPGTEIEGTRIKRLGTSIYGLSVTSELSGMILIGLYSSAHVTGQPSFTINSLPIISLPLGYLSLSQ